MLGKLFATGLALSALLATTGLITLQVANRATMEDMPFAKQIRCAFDRDTACLRNEIAALREARDRAARELERLEAERRAFQGADVVQTTSGDLGGWYVYVVAVYDNPDKRTGLTMARCHAARDRGGPDHDLLLAKWADGRIEPARVDPAFARRLDFSADDIARGLSACPWPAST